MSSYFFLSVLCVQTLSELRKAFRALNPNSLYQECKCVCDCVTRQGLATSAGSTIRVARWTAAGVRVISGQLMELSLALSGHNITMFQSLKTWAYGFHDLVLMAWCYALCCWWKHLYKLAWIYKQTSFIFDKTWTTSLIKAGRKNKSYCCSLICTRSPFICTLSVNSLFLFTAPLTLCCMAKLPARPLSEAMSPHHVCPSGL